MRRVLIALALATLSSATLAPPASAAAAGCAAFSPGPPLPLGLAVPPAYPNVLGAACVGGLSFTSATAPCPLNLAPVAVPGAYCGVVGNVLPGAVVACTGRAVGGATYQALTIGLDFFPYNGHVAGGEPLVYEGVYAAAVHSAAMVNPSPLPARVIAYPTGVAAGPISVTCVPA